MTGNDNFLPVMADCERALGRPQAALRLIREGQEADLTPAQQVELVLVQAGARRDLDQKAEAVRLLREAVKNLKAPTEATARLHYAYAETLLEEGDTAGARKWFVSAQSHDPANFHDCGTASPRGQGWLRHQQCGPVRGGSCPAFDRHRYPHGGQ